MWQCRIDLVISKRSASRLLLACAPQRIREHSRNENVTRLKIVVLGCNISMIGRNSFTRSTRPFRFCATEISGNILEMCCESVSLFQKYSFAIFSTPLNLRWLIKRHSSAFLLFETHSNMNTDPSPVYGFIDARTHYIACETRWFELTFFRCLFLTSFLPHFHNRHTLM